MTGRRKGDDWPKAKVELLKLMAAAGETGAAIAVRLGTSRSAVAGKVKRLGLRLGGERASPARDLSFSLPEPPGGIVMPSGVTMMPIEVDVSVICTPDVSRVDVSMTAQDLEPRSAFSATVIVDAAPASQPKPKRTTVHVPHAATCEEAQAIVDATVSFAPPLTPKGWPKPAGPNAVSLQDLRERHCRMPLWADSARTGLFCGEATAPGQTYCAACRPLIPDARQSRRVQERAANSAKFAAAGRTGAFA
ncbi:GcrA family cell cycle regulator [Bosea vestrisii]|uniref:GcrA family cell cycle regulator n=1 Tax=Bosea vestrisii TaxID=151416 RepID=A0ABW0H5P2_9HYPH